MALKIMSPEKQVAQEYRRWLDDHPDAVTKVKVKSFNRIADRVYKEHEAMRVA